jgi:dolichyl-phosphate-mannose--protein O-mannosyl transferase
VLLWHRDRHWWAGLAFGLALGCKWSAIYFIAVIALVSLYRILVNMDIRDSFKLILKKFAQYGLLPIVVYLMTWTGWFISNRGWDRQSSSNFFYRLVELSPRDAQLSYRFNRDTSIPSKPLVSACHGKTNLIFL